MIQINGTAVGSKGLRILAIGLDETALTPDKAVEGDTIQRITKYGKVLDSLHVVVFTKDRTIPARVQVAENVFCYPARSRYKTSFFKKAYRIASKIQEKENCDLIYTQDCFSTGLVGYLLKRNYNLPLCFFFAGDMLNNPHWLKERALNRFFNVLGNWLITKADALRVISNSEKEKLINLGLPPEKIWNLGSITDFSRFLQADGASLRSRFLGRDGQFRLLLFVGRLVPQKDPHTLLQALAIILKSHPEVLLLMVGQGPLQGELQELAAGLGIEEKVIFAGSVPYDELPFYYAACDVLVLSSVYEGNARVLAEVAATAKPVVATEVSGTRDTVIDGETGFIVPSQDPGQLAHRVIRLLDNPERAKSMGLRGREHVLQLYSEENLLNGFKDMWETTVFRYKAGSR